MKIINILFCLFFILLNSCNSDNNDAFKKDNQNNSQEVKSRKKRDLSEQEKPKSPEELLREKLSNDQKTQLDWLKTALTDAGEFDTFLQYNEDKIKSALDHIKKELENCTGDKAEQKNTFKQVVQGALKGGIDGFAGQASSTCNNS
ncbi:mlp lipofamily protein (plasmid) [Borreliella afzelii PKo]|uniref:Mlp lipofamily protein n=1 Tax=Borreliella afzelii (strain PKo) TaxID=390236 RepID=G0IT61_BORAP|nr:mlp lipofamily protein [Borreliella afzelii PKo]